MEPSGSPPGHANRNRKQSLTVIPNPIPNPYTSHNPLLRYDDFSIFFQDGGHRHLGFRKCGILGVVKVKRDKMRHHAEFHGDWSNRC